VARRRIIIARGALFLGDGPRLYPLLDVDGYLE